MGAVYMTVRVENELSAVAMPLPFRDDFHVHAKFYGASNEQPPERAVTVGRKP
jgi:hypothetical protein